MMTVACGFQGFRRVPLFGYTRLRTALSWCVELCQGKVVTNALLASCVREVITQTIDSDGGSFLRSHPNKRGVFSIMKAKTLSVLAAIPWLSLALGTAPAFAQSPAAVNQHLSQKSPIIPSGLQGISPTLSAVRPFAGIANLPPTFSQTSPQVYRSGGGGYSYPPSSSTTSIKIMPAATDKMYRIGKEILVLD